jgi:hypothetical protein
VTRCREIILSGTSSDRQLEEYELAIGTESHENDTKRL